MKNFRSILGWMSLDTRRASRTRFVGLGKPYAALTLAVLGALHLGSTQCQAETISGRVTSGGVGVPGVAVTTTSLPNQNFGWNWIVFTDANGNWTANTCDCLGGALENYKVSFSGGGVDGFFPDAYDTIPVTTENIVNLNAEVRRGPVSGRATEGSIGIPNVFVLTERLFEFHRAPNLAIPDNGAAISDSQALGGANITTIRVWLSVTHTFIGDLEATLIHPDGTRVRLHSHGGSSADNINHIYPDTASPVDSLSVLVGKSINGTWRMEVRDTATRDIGFLNGWGMILSGSLTSTTTDANGNYTLTNMTYGSVLNPTKSGVTFSPATVIAKSPAAANFSAVGVAPTISDIPNITVQEDHGQIALNFTVSDNAIPAANLTVTAAASGEGTNPNLIPPGNISLGGSGANRNITVTPAANANGTTIIHVTVNDGTYSTTDAFTVTVNPVNDPPTVPVVSNLTINEDTSTTINITIDDVDTPAANLILSATSADQNLILDSALVTGGSGANRTLTLTPRPNANGNGIIRVAVNDGQATVSNVFLLIVNPANDQPVAGPLTGVRLEGLDEYVLTPSVGSGLAGNASHTLEMWVRPDPIYSGVFASDFESGTPAGMTVSINATVSGGYLRLTPASGGQYGVAAVDNFGGSAPVDRFRASFKLAMFGGSGFPADGFSFNLVPAAAVSATPAAIAFEDGFPQGLAVNFDTWDNGAGEAPSVEVKWQGNVVARVPYQASAGASVTDPAVAARDVFINLDPDGTIDVQVDSQHLIQNVPTGYNPAAIGTPRWILGARTGGSFDNHWVDNLRIEAPSTSVNNNARRVIATLGNLSGAGHYWLLNPAPDSTNSLLECGIVNTRVLLSGLPIPANKWTHIAATWNSANATYTVYLDGEQSGQVTGGGVNFNLAGVPLNLGQGFSGAANFRGNLDDVRLWSTALDPLVIADNRGYPLRGGEPDLQVYHRFDETVGVTVTDSAAFRGNSDGVLVNGAAYGIPAMVPVAGSLRFDGVNDEVVVTALPGLGVGNVSHTLEAWIKPAPMQFAERSWPLTLGQSGNGAHHWLLNSIPGNPNRVTIQFGIWGGTQVEGPTLEVNAWTHVAATWNSANNTFTLYTNAVFAGQANAGGANNFTTNLLTLGRTRIGGERAFAGALDEVRVWTRVLTPAELAASRANSVLGNEAGLIAYYRLDEGGGPVIADGAGGDNVGVIAGNPTWTEPAPTLAGLVATSTNAPTGFGIPAVNEDVPKRIFLSAFDVEQYRVEGSLSFTVINLPQYGTVAPTSGVWSNATQNPVLYTPLTNYTGPDSFTFRVTDSSGLVSGVYTVPVLVQATNDPPTIGVIRDLIIEENTSSEPITFTVADNDTPLENLSFSPRSSDDTIINLSGIQITGSGAVRTLVIRPVTNEVGAVTITIGVTDRIKPTDQPAIFRVRVVPKPAYAIVNLGTLSGYAQSYGRAVNNLGWVAGMAQLPPSDAHAFLFKGIEGPSGLTDLGTLGGLIAEGNGLNDLNFVTGVSTLSDGRRQAFRWGNSTMTPLGFLGGGSFSEGRSINSAGLVAGAGTAVGGVTNAFLYGGAMTNLGTLPGGSRSEAFALNEASEVAGYSTVAGGAERAFLYRNGAMANLGTLPNHVASRAHAINNSGQVAGYSQTNTGARTAVVFDGTANTNIAIGTLPGGAFSVANGINDFGQVVGQAGNAANGNSAFLYSANRLHDLNDIISSEDAELWRLQDARAINREGFIVGTGLLNGSGGGTRAFLALPAWVIGRPIPRPEGAVKLQPEIEVLSGPGNPANSFFWSTVESRLYAIRPVTARLRWFIEEPNSGAPLNTNRIVTVGIAVWPRQPTVHVANTPSDIEPRNVGFPYSFQRVIYQQADGVEVEPSTKRFTASTPGYSVLHYIRNNGATPRPDTHPPAFDVVRTVNWDDSRHLISSNWTVGTVVGHATHFDYAGRNGFVYFPKTFIDSVGADRAYDRDSRQGAIIPVNAPTDRTSGENDPLVVVWYRLNGLGAAWSSTPVRYALNWPANAPRIIIASAIGSEPMSPLLFPEGRIYNQPIRSLPGYNPNEEHALVRAANGGQVVYALRDDLNWEDTGRTQAKVSPPFALFKHRDPTSGEWRIRAFQVEAEGLAYNGTNYGFTYPAVAGNELTPPFPISTLPVCTDSHGVPGSGPWWEDVKGKIYARAAGPEGGNTNILVRWFYPLQPGFSYDIAFDGTNDEPDGTCLAWLDRRRSLASDGTPGTPGTPIDVTYNTRWPDNANVLQIGETLLDSRRNLPDVLNMAAVKIIYDDLNPTDTDQLASLARFYDPVSARTVALPAGFVWPEEISRENISGKEYFPGLPYALKQRLYHDPINRILTFQGVLKLNFSLGQNPHLLLPNVISPRERQRILALSPANSGWVNAISNLFQLTRNPNGVDLDNTGGPDRELRIGLTTVDGVVVPEQFGDGPKALSAALADVPPPPSRPGNALQFDTATSAVDLGSGVSLGGTFTEEAWIYPQATVATSYHGILGHDPDGSAIHRAPSLWVHDLNRVAYGFGDGAVFREGETAPVLQAGAWNHLAATFDGAAYRIYVNGFLVRTDTNFAGSIPAATPVRYLGERAGRTASFAGRMDEVRLWNIARSGTEIAALMRKRLNGAESGLVGLWRCDEGAGNSLSDAGPLKRNGALNGVSWFDLEEQNPVPTWGLPPRYITIAENDALDLPGLPITLRVIRVDDGPYPGDLKTLPSDNVFDERVSMRHSSDFGGAPERLAFQWYYKPDEADFDNTDLPQIDPATGDLVPGQERGWTLFPSAGAGINDITLGEGGESSLVTLGDNWFICRYRGYNVNGNTNWSNWIGQEEGRAQLVQGWIKRVVAGLNQFDARTDDFHSSPSSTFASMLIQAGERYEGPIAFNPDAGNLNSLGLIEAYTTVFERARDLSIQGAPPVNFDAANNALLLVASRISDLYMLLGNEAYADAQDPTIGFGTTSGEYGGVASSIFTFQNQLDSLLEEELVLLRGLDNRGRSVRLPPTYNRLIWNFTLGEGEVAYRQTYNIGDQTFDGFINEHDARVLYPQGHGDAYGHYLTALKTYYFLMRHPNFTWKPRTEPVSVAGATVQVDFLDERKFARVAAAKAKAGRDIVDLTYRNSYVEDPAGQWQGYKDTDANRAWGVDDWARRVNQGGYLDWLAANAILPSTDPNPNHTGIQKIDRQTVSELAEIAAQALEVQTRLDQADVGLNPVGIAKGSVPFDIDPTFLEVGSTAQIGRRAVQGLTQFDQILERAVKSVKNSMAVWDEANKATELIRRTQDSVDDFTQNVRDQEVDYKNRLIEIFGYPYAGDIGAGKTYRSGYDGPDLVHHMYISTRTATGETAPPGSMYTGYFQGNATDGYVFSPTDEDYDPYTTDTAPVQVDYPLSSGSWAFDAPASWGERRAPGELQLALSDLAQAENNLKLAIQNYDGVVYDIVAQAKVLKAQRNLNATNIVILNRQKNESKRLDDLILAAQRGEVSMRRISSTVSRVAEAVATGIPQSADIVGTIGGSIRAAILGVSIGVSEGLETVADVLQVEQTIQDQAKEQNDLQIAIDLQVEEQNFELLQSIEELNHTVRDEISLRLELYNQAEVVRQTLGRYQAKLAEGQRLLDELERFRKSTAAQITEHRYEDMTFRIFRNDALQKYRASFDIAARYVYLAANAYDYEINFLRTDQRAGSRFLTEIVRQRNLGQLLDGEPVVGQPGLCDLLGRMVANWEVLKPQFGVSAPQIADTRFSLREELFRIRGDTSDEAANESWREALTKSRVANLWDVPEFRRYCRPFAPELLGAQPAIVIRFPTTITFGLNYFGWPLAGGDSAYDPSQFSTKIARAGVWFSGSDGTQISQTPRIYLVPVGMDIQRSPTGDTLATREWRIIDQAVPPPFPIGASDLDSPGWIPAYDTLGGTFAQIRRYGSFGAKHDEGIYSEDDLTNDTRLIGRSAWNTEWLMIIPGGTLLFDPNQGLQTFINTVSDIKVYFQTYSYAGN